MKNLLFCCVVILVNFSIFGYSEGNSPSDSTRSRDNTSTTKERVKKDGSDSRSGNDNYSENENSSFADFCLSTCFNSMFEALISSITSGPSETTDQFVADSCEAENIQGNNETAGAKSIDEKIYYQEEVIKKTNFRPVYRDYIRIGIAGESFTGAAAEEHNNPLFSYRLSNMVYMHGFVINASFSQGFGTGNPEYDYKTTVVQGTTIKKINDVASSVYSRTTGFSLSASYMADFSEFFGMKIGAGGLYQSVHEETELQREIIINNVNTGTQNITEELDFSGLYPMFLIDFYLYTNPEATVVFDLSLQYNFINREPQKIKSTPLDWNNLAGEMVFGFGVSFDIL